MHHMTPPRATTLLLALVAAFGVAACGNDDDAAPEASSSPEAAEVAIEDFEYLPEVLEVAPGTQVTFRNEDDAGHTATAKGAFDTDDIGRGADADVTAPEEPGTYEYICSLHPFMKGTLVVR
jgi:plastocyanin